MAALEPEPQPRAEVEAAPEPDGGWVAEAEVEEEPLVQESASLSWEQIAELPPSEAARVRAAIVLRKKQAEREAAVKREAIRKAALRQIYRDANDKRAASPKHKWVSPHVKSTFDPLPARCTVYANPMEHRATGRNRKLVRRDGDGREKPAEVDKYPGKYVVGGEWAADFVGPGESNHSVHCCALLVAPPMSACFAVQVRMT